MAGLWARSFPVNTQASSGLESMRANTSANSGFRFIVEFGGICCFAPAEDGKSLGVFLADQSEEPADSEVPRHKAVVQFPLARVKGVSGVPETTQGLWKPVAQEIRFEFDGDSENRELEISGFDQNTRTIPDQPLTTPPAEHFYWVSSVGDAFRRRGLSGARIRPGLKADLLDPVHADLLAARVLLTRGRVRPVSFVREGDHFVVWRFRPESVADDDAVDHKQFVASRVLLEMDVPAASVRLVARDLVTGDEDTVVELAPNGTNEVRVVILNEESDEILGLGSPPPIELGVLRKMDRIFRSVLRLIEPGTTPEQVPLPIAAALNPPFTGRRGGPVVRNSPPCSPYRVDG